MRFWLDSRKVANDCRKRLPILSATPLVKAIQCTVLFVKENGRTKQSKQARPGMQPNGSCSNRHESVSGPMDSLSVCVVLQLRHGLSFEGAGHEERKRRRGVVA